MENWLRTVTLSRALYEALNLVEEEKIRFAVTLLRGASQGQRLSFRLFRMQSCERRISPPLRICDHLPYNEGNSRIYQASSTSSEESSNSATTKNDMVSVL
jgi:hypothetical protein